MTGESFLFLLKEDVVRFVDGLISAEIRALYYTTEETKGIGCI